MALAPRELRLQICSAYDTLRRLSNRAPFCPAVLARSELDVTTEAKTVNHKYLNYNQLIARLTEWKRAARMSELQVFNLKKKAAILVNNLALDKRILLLIAQGNIAGVQRVLAQALKRGSTSHGILAKLESALTGSYSARGWSEEDFDLALLILRLGGPALLNVLHKTTGLPGLTLTRNHAGTVSNFISV